MSKIHGKIAHGLGSESSENMFTKNHFASTTPMPRKVTAFIADWGMVRVAGNVYECPSTKDFWKVQGGSIKKLVGNEVDNGESIPAASDENPAKSLTAFLDDLEF